MAYLIGVKYFNSFWLKKVVGDSDATTCTSPLVSNVTGAGDDSEGGGYSAGVELATWPGLPWNPDGYPKFPWGLSSNNSDTCDVFECTGICTNPEWFVEESRIRGGYNNTTVDLGVKAYIVEDTNAQQHRSNSLIYSGIYNSRTGVNNTNVFSIGEDITKSIDPVGGSIQKLYAEDTNLTIFQENKVSRALIDKDAIYTAEGSPMRTQSNVVIGQIIPYLGEYGISRNPESFAIYGYRKYFADKDRGVILRLSRDGIEEISRYGMTDYFRDYLSNISDKWKNVDLSFSLYENPTNTSNIIYITPQENCNCDSIDPGMVLILNSIDTGLFIVDVDEVGTDEDRGEYMCIVKLSNTLSSIDDFGDITEVRLRKYIKSKIVGGWDIHARNYTVSMQPAEFSYNACGIETEYSTLGFDEGINGWVSFYTYKPTIIDSLKNKFYSVVGNTLYKHYNEDAINERGTFYGTQSDSSISFVINPKVSLSKNFQSINYEGSNGWEVDSFVSDIQEPGSSSTGWVDNFDSVGYALSDGTNRKGIYSYEEGSYVDSSDGITYRLGFKRKENKYSASLVNNSVTRADEVIIGPDGFGGYPTTGIKGYFATVTMSTDASTELGGKKELFAVSANYVSSSY
ncbi:hypothetical protein CMI37_18165 [Candidatus Pacearchaeota archaeon]|nr:hypothetical protein [Candidatus Pacearchaeota archaeon]|tara:strand:+ start:8043 stop:9923 length:1881 start_codon:yes stop_codon:yes gene_type:complete